MIIICSTTTFKSCKKTFEVCGGTLCVLHFRSTQTVLTWLQDRLLAPAGGGYLRVNRPNLVNPRQGWTVSLAAKTQRPEDVSDQAVLANKHSGSCMHCWRTWWVCTAASTEKLSD